MNVRKRNHFHHSCSLLSLKTIERVLFPLLKQAILFFLVRVPMGTGAICAPVGDWGEREIVGVGVYGFGRAQNMAFLKL